MQTQAQPDADTLHLDVQMEDLKRSNPETDPNEQETKKVKEDSTTKPLTLFVKEKDIFFPEEEKDENDAKETSELISKASTPKPVPNVFDMKQWMDVCCDSASEPVRLQFESLLVKEHSLVNRADQQQSALSRWHRRANVARGAANLLSTMVNMMDTHMKMERATEAMFHEFQQRPDLLRTYLAPHCPPVIVKIVLEYERDDVQSPKVELKRLRKDMIKQTNDIMSKLERQTTAGPFSCGCCDWWYSLFCCFPFCQCFCTPKLHGM